MSNEIGEEKLREYFDVSLDLVRKCGPLFNEGFQKANIEFETKTSIYDRVTYYDKKLEEVLSEGLLKAFPESKIIGEETQSLAELTDAPTWIIDPIDGTNNYISKVIHCCISVGLAINKELVAGIIYNPTQNEMYTARKGHGAFLNGEPIYVNSVKTIKDADTVGFEASLIVNPQDGKEKLVHKWASHRFGPHCFGSAALTLCYIAKGKTDVYHVERLKPWDLAAGAVILREAGGTVIHPNGGTFDVMHPDCVCACTSELAINVVQLIEEAKVSRRGMTLNKI